MSASARPFVFSRRMFKPTQFLLIEHSAFWFGCFFLSNNDLYALTYIRLYESIYLFRFELQHPENDAGIFFFRSYTNTFPTCRTWAFFAWYFCIRNIATHSWLLMAQIRYNCSSNLGSRIMIGPAHHSEASFTMAVRWFIGVLLRGNCDVYRMLVHHLRRESECSRIDLTRVIVKIVERPPHRPERFREPLRDLPTI